MEFRESDCYKQALQICSSGSAILTELLRLSNYIPDVFLLKQEKNPKGGQVFYSIGNMPLDNAGMMRYSEQLKYLRILFDLDYVKQQDIIDQQIQASVALIELDENFKETYLDIIERFYSLFESIYTYYQSVTTYLSDVGEGKYIEFTLEAILQDSDGKTLIVETVYHYGVMLLLLDRLIPSIARERMISCYIRYMSGSASQLTSYVVALAKQTGYSYDSREKIEVIPDKYPAAYFNRFKIDRELVESLINSMKDDDIYDMLTVYGNTPSHRSIALSTQAAIIFTLLPFCPRILDSQEPKMREICDKHFPDNWVIPIYGGVLCDLELYWQSFPAAIKAFRNNIVQDRVQYFAEYHQKQMLQVQKKLKKYIIDGQLQEKEALDNVKNLTKQLREANTTLRWVMLHQHCQNPALKKIVAAIVNKEQLVNYILELSKFESLLKDLLTLIVTKKRQVWENNKTTCVKYMTEVSEFFQGNRNWGQEYIDQDLSEYFKKIAQTIEDFEYSSTTKVGRKIQKMIQALEDLQLQYSIIDENVQIQANVTRTMDKLRNIIQIMGIKKNLLGQILIIVDFSYAWVIIYDYIDLLQKTISDKPKSVLMLKAVFIKLSTIMEKPLMRILQAGSPDLMSVSRFYSGQLFRFVKSVLQIIPVNIFKQLDDISVILATQIPELETRISKETLKEAAKPEQRYKLAESTHRITMFTEGMLVLDKVLMSVTEIEPKEILIDGLRKELCKKMANMLHQEFIFKDLESTSTGIDHSKQGAMGEFGVYEAKFLRIKANFVGLKRSIEYIQDFLNVQGEKIWREELSRIVDFAVEKEATRLVSKKLDLNIDDENTYKPEFDPVDTLDQTFMGRLLRNILGQMDRGFYLDHMSTWYSQDGKQVFGLRYINFLHEHLGTIFLQGLDKLIVYNIVAQLRRLYSNYGLFFGGGNITQEMKKKFEKKEAVQFIQEIKNVDQILNGNFESLNEVHWKNYNALLQNISKFKEVLMPELLTIGKLQILRRLITKQIHFLAKVECSQYESCLSTLNTTVINNMQEIREGALQAYAVRDEDPDQPQSAEAIRDVQGNQNAILKKLKEMLSQLTKALETIGIVNPYNKVYSLTKPLEKMSLFMALFTLSALREMRYDQQLSTIRKIIDPKNPIQKGEIMLDGPHFIVGMLTLFKQFHNSQYRLYVEHLAHYYKNMVHVTQEKQIPPEGAQVLVYLDELMKFDGEQREVVGQSLGGFVFDCYNI